jgi:hypothetical protein
MKVSVKNLSVTMEIKNKGVELDVYDNNDNHLGDLIVTKTGLTWCKGKTTATNGKKITWDKFITRMEKQRS